MIERKGKGTCSCIIHIELVDRYLEGKKKHINYTKNNETIEKKHTTCWKIWWYYVLKLSSDVYDASYAPTITILE